MKKIILIILAILLVGGVIGGSIYKYEHRSKVSTETLSQALQGQKSAQQEVLIHDAVNETSLKQDETQISTLQNNQAQLCAVLSAHKLTSSICP
jgi:uncharacterized protein YxeA